MSAGSQPKNQVSLVLVFNPEGKLLLGKRNDNGRYTTPGGHANPGESPKRAAIRELLEETALVPDSLAPLKSYHIGPTTINFFKGTSSDALTTGAFDPDEECSEWFWCPVPLPSNVVKNLHGPTPEKNPLKELVGYSTTQEPLVKAQLQKMALADIPVGREVELHGQHPDEKIFDYNHLLPQHIKDQNYKLYVHEGKDHTSPGSPTYLRAAVHHPSYGIQEHARGDFGHPEVGITTGTLHRDKSVSIFNTLIPNQLHRSKGLGLTMYEALMAHAKNKHRATHASSASPHSTMAMRVHRALAEKHGMKYEPKPRFGGQYRDDGSQYYKNRLEWMKAGDPKNLKPYDDRFAGYRYALKSEEKFTMKDLLKALTDIKVGKERPVTGPAPAAAKEFDYTHHLPQHLKAQGYKLRVQELPGHDYNGVPDDSTHLRAVIHHPQAPGSRGIARGEAGVVAMKVHQKYFGPEKNTVVGVDNAIIPDQEHQGKGLGVAMYEAGMAHAANKLGATHAFSDDSLSSMANRVHQSLSRRHGLNYQPVKNIGGAQYPTEWMWENNHFNGDPSNLEYDGRYKGYHYAIKSEGDFLSQLLRHPDPRERKLALKMGTIDPSHLIEALRDKDLHQDILQHPAFNGQVLEAIFNDANHSYLWHQALSHADASPANLHQILDTTPNLDLWEKLAGQHDLADASIHNRLLDQGHHSLLQITQDKDQMRDFVGWHLEDPGNMAIASKAFNALQNPMCPESLLDDAMDSRTPTATKLAALQNQTYLSPKAMDYLTKGVVGLTDPQIRLAILSHPKATPEMAKTALNDKDPYVANAARQILGGDLGN